MSIAAMRRYALWSLEVTQAYLQSAAMMSRFVYVRPRKEKANAQNLPLRLRKALYGLSDSGDYLHDALARVLKDDVGMSAETGDPALYFRGHTQGAPLEGVLVTQVADGLATGSPRSTSATLTGGNV